jgi:hypothetical protein
MEINPQIKLFIAMILLVLVLYTWMTDLGAKSCEGRNRR